MRCHICGKPASCVGRYDIMEKDEPACDDCCGHGNEDGHCAPIPVLLILDDDAPIRRALARVLGPMGWIIRAAESPLQPREVYDDVAVVLSDWDMPDGGGARVLAESPAPVVIYTGRPDAPPAGTRVLCKPSEIEAIDAALRAAMKGAA